MKTRISYVAALVLGLICAKTAQADDLTLTFAKCAGRYSAQMEHQWLLGKSGEDAGAERAAMIALLEAVMPAARAREALSKRIEAKFAQSRLLTRATFTKDQDSARWAARRAAEEIGSCRALMTG